MLGSITRSLPEIYTRLASRPFVSEAKLDGQRGQIHVWVSDPSLNEPSRPPGVRETSGMFFSGQDVGDSRVGEQLKGKKVWVRLFSRHLEDMTQKYPDLIGTVAVRSAFPALVLWKRSHPIGPIRHSSSDKRKATLRYATLSSIARSSRLIQTRETSRRSRSSLVSTARLFRVRRAND